MSCEKREISCWSKGPNSTLADQYCLSPEAESKGHEDIEEDEEMSDSEEDKEESEEAEIARARTFANSMKTDTG